ncbi:MAG: ribbon-helix-helix protein, CopG family, partial [Actinomycetota bacterium]|nr:ribbon-helix-helix protein, CopG family [Actinomycetota bacterium]
MRKSSLYLPDRLKADLTARAGATGRSEADLIRDALQAALTAPVAPGPDPLDRPVPGRLVGVGVGPGEADLMTVRALNALRR